jgi:GDP-mannose 6-dehydrogenase
MARDGHSVVGMDLNQAKVDRVNSGHSTILEEGIDALVGSVVQSGRLRATTDVADAVGNSDITLICVGTPSRRNGDIDLTYVKRVCRQIGEALRKKDGWHAVVIRSTVLPGTIETLVIPELEAASGRKIGPTLGVASNPEFLREGSSIRDYDDPPFTIVGASDPATGKRVGDLYRSAAPVRQVPIRVAESLKYACNAFHALKVGFANEIGAICKSVGVDSHEVMRLLTEDTKLNISPRYLKPGFAFGGSCLPKDLRALVYHARDNDVDTPLLTGLLESNRRQIERAYHLIQAAGKRHIAVLGLAFKSGTDDLRESPMVTLVEMLVGRGYQLRIHDPDVREASITGANREYVDTEIPHLWTLFAPDLATAIADAEIIIVANGGAAVAGLPAMLKPGQRVVDLVRVELPGKGEWSYEGIAW